MPVITSTAPRRNSMAVTWGALPLAVKKMFCTVPLSTGNDASVRFGFCSTTRSPPTFWRAGKAMVSAGSSVMTRSS